MPSKPGPETFTAYTGPNPFGPAQSDDSAPYPSAPYAVSDDNLTNLPPSTDQQHLSFADRIHSQNDLPTNNQYLTDQSHLLTYLLMQSLL